MLIKLYITNRFRIRPNLEFTLLMDDLMTNWFSNFAHISLFPITASILHAIKNFGMIDVSLYTRLTTFMAYAHDGRVLAATRKGKPNNIFHFK